MGCNLMTWEMTGWIALACIVFTPMINSLIRFAGAIHMTRWQSRMDAKRREDKP
jgi:hypothetical protein